MTRNCLFSSFSSKYPKSQKFQDKNLFDLSKILLKNRSVSHLLLSFDMYFFVYNFLFKISKLAATILQIKVWPNYVSLLKNFELLKPCISALGSKKNLQALRIRTFFSIGRIGSKGFHQLLKSITRLPMLKDFGLYFAP